MSSKARMKAFSCCSALPFFCQFNARLTSLPAQTDLRVVTAKVFDTLAETQHPQGVLAAVRLPLLEPETSSPRLSLIADQIRDPGNLGTMLRSAVAAGATSVSITRGSVHPDNRKAVRAGMGAHFRIPINVFSEFGSLTSFLADHEQVVVCDASGDRDYDQINYEVPTAILIGGEAEGVDPAVLRFATTVVLPSPGRAEVTAIARGGLSTSTYCRLVRMVR